MENFSSSKLKKLLKEVEPEALEFFTECAKYDKTIVPSKQLSIVNSQLSIVLNSQYAMHNAQLKKIGDLQKALLKAKETETFTKLMMQNDEKLPLQLLCWALCGSLATNGLAQKFNFARKFSQYIKELELSEVNYRPELTKLFTLATVSDSTKVSTPAKARIQSAAAVNLIVNSPYRYSLSGANNFDNVWWFNKELTEDSINKVTLLMLLGAKKAAIPKVLIFYKNLCTAKLKAAYKCELFVKAFAPVKKAKAPAKKAPAKKAKAPAKKAPAKKLSTKKKTSPTKK